MSEKGSSSETEGERLHSSLLTMLTLFFASMFAPLSAKSVAISRWPLWVAYIKAVKPI